MDVAALSTELAVVNVANRTQVSVFNKQSDQLEAVVSTILSGIEAAPAPRIEGQTGQILNVAA